MELLERETYLQELEKTFNSMSEGGGFVVLISGEAGIGKTSLVETFLSKIEGKANILWGACDALFTPRPLGPLYDIAAQLKNGLLNLLDKKADRATIFTRFLQELQESKVPNILIIEDVHWADESTLDLIKFLGRRANKINSLFIITYRDDEISSKHPLRFVLGDIASNNLIRFKLESLTENTVNELSNLYGIKNLFQISGGNPFLVNELISNKNEIIPQSVKDSILTRLSRLSKQPRDLVELLSIIPNHTEKWLLNEIIPLKSKIIDECLNSGILKTEEEFISFKHELSRMAVEETLSATKKIELNDAVLQILLKQKHTESFLARIIHHATKADNKDIIIEYAAVAANQASKLGAHIQAVNHFKNVLRYINDIPLEKQIDLYEGKSYECYLTGQIEEGIEAGEKVLELLKTFQDAEREGEIYRKLSKMLLFECQSIKAVKYLNKAIEILEKLPPGRSLAMAYSYKSTEYMLKEETKPAVEWGIKAVELARKLNDLEIEAHALNNMGSAKMLADDLSGEDDLKKSLEISLNNEFHEHVSRAYSNLGSNYLEERNIKEANQLLLAALEHTHEHELDLFGLYAAGHYALVKLYLGEWDEAIEIVNNILNKGYVPKWNKIIPLCVLGLVRARRNDPGSINLLKESNLFASTVDSIDQITVKAALVEAFWLRNENFNITEEIKEYYSKIKDTRNPWATGALAYWLWKADCLPSLPKKIAKPYSLQIKGDWKSAAKLWEELNCPYEQAMALCEGNEHAMKSAIEIFDRLGASSTSSIIKHKMRELGIRGIPKGPRETTKKNLAGLTIRQIEVLKLLGKGLSNNEIGTKLFISPKTVDHHISAILSKLNMHTRTEAAAFVHSNLTPQK